MRPDLKITHITTATFQAVLSLWCKIYHKDATPETQLAVTETTGNLQVDSDPLNSNTIKQHLRGSMSCFLCFCETPGYLGTLAKVLCVFACPSLFLFWNYKEKNFHWTIRCGTEKTRSYRSSSLATGRIKIRVFPFDKLSFTVLLLMRLSQMHSCLSLSSIGQSLLLMQLLASC